MPFLEYVDAVLYVASVFINGKKILNDMNWKREEKYKQPAQKLVDFYGETQGALALAKALIACKMLERMFAERATWYPSIATLRRALSATIRGERRDSVVNHALHTLKAEFSVDATGQTWYWEDWQLYDTCDTGTPPPKQCCALCGLKVKKNATFADQGRWELLGIGKGLLTAGTSHRLFIQPL